MAPSTTTPITNANQDIEMAQPTTNAQSMSLQPTPSNSNPTNNARATESQKQEEMTLRGGDRGGCCPGRFCFIIPCPLPCDCCII